jgi:hypothetical protein
MAESSGMTPDGILELFRTGKAKTQNDVALHFGVKRQAVSQMMKRHGIRRNPTPREVALEHYPWETGVAFNDAYENRCMRDHAELMATGGKGMSEWKLERLRKFYKLLQENDEVIEFDPSIPPPERREANFNGPRSVGGFAWRKRRPSDGDLIIRVNKHTKLTEQGRMLWRFPPRLP